MTSSTRSSQTSGSKMSEELSHDYDATKRREYYLRTRQLKGRKPGSVKTTKPRLQARPKPPKKTRAQRQAERRRKIQAQVEELKIRLAHLRFVMAEETKKAQARSGVKPSKTPAKKAGTKKAAAKKLTVSEKNKAAKRSAEYRKKNPDLALDEQVKSLNAKIKTIQERIAKIRKTGSVGARKT